MVDIVCTLGPSCDTVEILQEMKASGMTFARINTSHVGLDYVKKAIPLCEQVGVPLIIDTAGAQVRTGDLEKSVAAFEEGDYVLITGCNIRGNNKEINLWPSEMVKQLEPGDMISIDFDALLLSVIEIIGDKVRAKVVNGGVMGRNKSVVVTDRYGVKRELPSLSEQDKEILRYSIENGIKYVAASFMNSSDDVKEVKKVLGNKVKIISKVESKKALANLNEIIELSDFILIDRGDLSKEISIERIPLTQKIIIKTASNFKIPVFVATNLLESMSEKRTPTRAEANDVINTILDGAKGLVLAGETAVGKYPLECVKMLAKLVEHSELVTNIDIDNGDSVLKRLEELNYISSETIAGNLVKAHGGRLVNRMLKKALSQNYIDSLYKIKIDENKYMDAEQIAIGAFSPIEGFMTQKELDSVLNNMRLSTGVVWTIPILFDINSQTANELLQGQQVGLMFEDEVVALFDVEEIYTYNKNEIAVKWFGTTSIEHPGVIMLNKMDEYLVGGKITLIKRKPSKFKEYELTPSQARKIFEEKGWSKIVGFHTRNAIHRSHEFLQMDAMYKVHADGLFIHPIIGQKKEGDFNSEFIIKSYELMANIYPKGKVVFGTFSTFSRYAGPREAIFTAICRKNFGCSHFIVGRDHTGVKDFYHPRASHEIFDKFPDLGIQPIIYDKVFYSKSLDSHIHEKEMQFTEEDKLQISGTQARNMLINYVQPPSWFMRPEISNMLLEAIKEDKEVFVSFKRNAKVIWFTGLSGSGKTTIALELKKKLESERKKTEIIDGDVIRNTLHKSLGFSREDIYMNNKLIAELCKQKESKFDFILVPIISPYKENREMARNLIGENFIELFISTPLEECAKRDVKGLYEKAKNGEITNLIGFSESNPYEAPQNANLIINTTNIEIEDAVSQILSFLNF
ncbi:sulfate adenylyltransferase [Candidatus Woesearchaeota archaeon]|nr:sulfate adenylyltransferase [Candidatus Woesearchaeota archaeon]